MNLCRIEKRLAPSILAYFTALTLWLVGISANAQLRFDYGFYDSIQVRPMGDTNALRAAWAGGFNAPQFSAIDANFDGIDDLFVFDRDGNVRFVFLNKGEFGNPDYQLDRALAEQFPKMFEYALMQDMNCDGKPDIVSSLNSNLKLFINESDSVLKFRHKDDFMFYNKQNGVIINQWKVPYVTTILQEGQPNEIKTNVGMPTTDIPALADVDGDGDIDILHFGANGNTVEYEKNVSLERFGTCDSLVFKNESRCWGEITEGFLDNTIYINQSCRPSQEIPLTDDFRQANASNQRHSGSSLTPIDLGGDSLIDLLIGDIGFDNLVGVENNGSLANAKITKVDTNFPSYNVSVGITLFPAGYYIDIDNDSKRELLVAPNEDNASINNKNVWLYENIGLDNSPVFQYQRNDFLTGDMIDLGSGANPVFVDIDGDSLLDIVSGNYGVFDGNGSYVSSLYFYKNIGEKQNPKFQLVDTNLFGLQSTNPIDLSPAFADLDFDGDLDLAIGNSDGIVLFYERTDTFSVQATNKFGSGIDVGQHAKPTFYDLGNDSIIDLIVGDRNGKLRWYRNSGPDSLIIFEPNVVVSDFGGVDVANQLKIGFSNAFFAELDSTGNASDTSSLPKETYLFVGSENGFVYLYNNIDSNLTGSFNRIDSLYTGYSRPVISGGDLTGNDKPDIVIGNLLGGLGIVMKDFGFIPAPPPQDTSSNTSASQILPNTNAIQLYPNPVSGLLTVTSVTQSLQASNVSVFDLSGRAVEVNPKASNAMQVQIDVSHLNHGVYFILIQTETEEIISKKFVKQ